MPEVVAETSQIFLRDTHISINHSVTGGNLVTMPSQSVSGVSAINPIVAF
jgi:hypothetical protein